jgi:alpha-galactosidase
VKEALDTYKRIRADIRRAFPFWPLGLSKYSDPWVSLGLRTDHRAYIAVWRRNSEQGTVTLPVPFLANKSVKARILYPVGDPCPYCWNDGTAMLSVTLEKPYSARIFLLEF